MHNKMKTVETQHLVRFADCDPFKHLNNSRYIEYFINAREDHLKQYYDFDMYKYIARTGKCWVVAMNQIAYFVPAQLMEKVVIQSTILELNASDILVEMRMWDEAKSRLKSIFWVRFVHTDLKELKRSNHDEALMEKFTPLKNSLPESITFEQRALQIRKMRYDEF